MPVESAKDRSILGFQEQTIVCPVNCEGVMGAGLALAFRKRFPDYYWDYKDVCEDGGLVPGKLHFFCPGMYWQKAIISFPTKREWRKPAELEYIRLGLSTLKKRALRRGIRDIGIPKIGCGCGGLNWGRDVRPLIVKTFEKADVRVVLYE